MRKDTQKRLENHNNGCWYEDELAFTSFSTHKNHQVAQNCYMFVEYNVSSGQQPEIIVWLYINSFYIYDDEKFHRDAVIFFNV